MATTVYAAFGSKRALLSALIDVSIAGDDMPVPILQRAWVEELATTPELRRRIRILAGNGRRILERRAPLDAVVEAAATTDPEIAELWRQLRDQRFAGQRALLELVIGSSGALRSGWTAPRAADVLYAIGSPEIYRLLVTDRGWSPVRFERWYADTLEALLFEL